MTENRASYVKTMAFIFVGGAVLGAVAGILLAPKSGEATRKDITDYASKVKGEVVDAAQRTKAGIEAAVEKGRALTPSGYSATLFPHLKLAMPRLARFCEWVRE